MAPTVLYGRHQAWWVHHFIYLYSYADAPISLQLGKSGLIKPQDLFPYSKVQSLCSQEKWSHFIQLASLISGFLKATQQFSPNPLSSVHTVEVEILLLSLLNIVSSTVEFLRIKWFWIVQDFFLTYFFLEGDGSPLSFQVVIMLWTVILFFY